MPSVGFTFAFFPKGLSLSIHDRSLAQDGIKGMRELPIILVDWSVSIKTHHCSGNRNIQHRFLGEHSLTFPLTQFVHYWTLVGQLPASKPDFWSPWILSPLWVMGSSLAYLKKFQNSSPRNPQFEAHHRYNLMHVSQMNLICKTFLKCMQKVQILTLDLFKYS